MTYTRFWCLNYAFMCNDWRKLYVEQWTWMKAPSNNMGNWRLDVYVCVCVFCCWILATRSMRQAIYIYWWENCVWCQCVSWRGWFWLHLVRHKGLNNVKIDYGRLVNFCCCFLVVQKDFSKWTWSIYESGRFIIANHFSGIHFFFSANKIYWARWKRSSDLVKLTMEPFNFR